MDIRKEAVDFFDTAGHAIVDNLVVAPIEIVAGTAIIATDKQAQADAVDRLKSGWDATKGIVTQVAENPLSSVKAGYDYAVAKTTDAMEFSANNPGKAGGMVVGNLAAMYVGGLEVAPSRAAEKAAVVAAEKAAVAPEVLAKDVTYSNHGAVPKAVEPTNVQLQTKVPPKAAPEPAPKPAKPAPKPAPKTEPTPAKPLSDCKTCGGGGAGPAGGKPRRLGSGVYSRVVTADGKVLKSPKAVLRTAGDKVTSKGIPLTKAERASMARRTSDATKIVGDRAAEYNAPPGVKFEVPPTKVIERGDGRVLLEQDYAEGVPLRNYAGENALQYRQASADFVKAMKEDPELQNALGEKGAGIDDAYKDNIIVSENPDGTATLKWIDPVKTTRSGEPPPRGPVADPDATVIPNSVVDERTVLDDRTRLLDPDRTVPANRPPPAPASTPLERARQKWESEGRPELPPADPNAKGPSQTPAEAERVVLEQYGDKMDPTVMKIGGHADQAAVLSHEDWQILARSVPGGETSAGFYYPGSGDIYVAPFASAKTAAHELIHSYTHPEFLQWARDLAGGDEAIFNGWNEGLTEWFAKKTAIEHPSIATSGYDLNVTWMDKIVSNVGSEAMEKAFFGGDVRGLEQALQKHLEMEGWPPDLDLKAPMPRQPWDTAERPSFFSAMRLVKGGSKPEGYDYTFNRDRLGLGAKLNGDTRLGGFQSKAAASENCNSCGGNSAAGSSVPTDAKEAAATGDVWSQQMQPKPAEAKPLVEEAPPPEPEIRMVNPKNLRPIHEPDSNSKVDRLRSKIKANGFDPEQPIDAYEVDGNLYIADGHHRALAAAKAGLKEVPVRVSQPTSPQQAEQLHTDYAIEMERQSSRER